MGERGPNPFENIKVTNEPEKPVEGADKFGDAVVKAGEKAARQKKIDGWFKDEPMAPGTGNMPLRGSEFENRDQESAA